MPKHTIPAQSIRPFAVYYIENRSYKNASLKNETSCQLILRNFTLNKTQSRILCRALMLQGQTEDDVSEIRNLGIEIFQTKDESQIKYMLFQTVLNYITKPSYTIEEIKNTARIFCLKAHLWIRINHSICAFFTLMS